MKLPAALKKPDLMIERFDHIVLTVSDIEASVAFYTRVLQMREHSFGAGRKALCFGTQKINLQVVGQEPRNNAATGSGDLCLITTWTPDRLIDHLRAQFTWTTYISFVYSASDWISAQWVQQF